MCQITPVTFPCCRRVYVEVKKLSTCSERWPNFKCPAELCLQIGTWSSDSAQNRDIGTCWRCQADRAGASSAQRERMRPRIDRAALVEGLEETTSAERRRRVEALGLCWFCNGQRAQKNCAMCDVATTRTGVPSTGSMTSKPHAKSSRKRRSVAPRISPLKRIKRENHGNISESGSSSDQPYDGNYRHPLQQMQYASTPEQFPQPFSQQFSSYGQAQQFQGSDSNIDLGNYDYSLQSMNNSEYPPVGYPSWNSAREKMEMPYLLNQHQPSHDMMQSQAGADQEKPKMRNDYFTSPYGPSDSNTTHDQSRMAPWSNIEYPYSDRAPKPQGQGNSQAFNAPYNDQQFHIEHSKQSRYYESDGDQISSAKASPQDAKDTAAPELKCNLVPVKHESIGSQYQQAPKAQQDTISSNEVQHHSAQASQVTSATMDAGHNEASFVKP